MATPMLIGAPAPHTAATGELNEMTMQPPAAPGMPDSGARRERRLWYAVVVTAVVAAAAVVAILVFMPTSHNRLASGVLNPSPGQTGMSTSVPIEPPPSTTAPATASAPTSTTGRTR